MNAATLRVQAPFLFLAIANSFVDKTEDLQEKIFTKINETISKRIVMNGEKSLELLQGLIVILAWFHFHTESVHQLSLIRHISISLVGDLGLDRPPGKDPNLGLKDELHCHTTITTDFVGSLAARRAFLGTYYLACIGGMFRRQQIVMKHTKSVSVFFLQSINTVGILVTEDAALFNNIIGESSHYPTPRNPPLNQPLTRA